MAFTTNPNPNAYPLKMYSPVYEKNNTFKQPRQKIWGVFIAKEKMSNGSSMNKWNLAYSSNDFNGAKEFFNKWLQNPEVDPKFAGMNNIIMVEIIPVNSNVQV